MQGYDFEHSNFETYDDKERHGTKVAGVIGAKANSGENSPCGVNWDVSLVPLQVWVEEEYPTESLKDAAFIENVLKAINWAQEQWGTENQIDILNCSITGYQTTAVRTAIQYFNGLVVFSAGNERPENGDIDSIFNSSGVVKPANLIIVGAIDSAGEVPTDWDGGKVSCYSSSGEHVNIYAPGDMIVTTSLNPPAQACVDIESGTSFAAPHVTGVAALLLSLNPNLTATQLKTAILSSAKSHLATLPNGQEQTIKLLDAYGAIKYILANHYDTNMSTKGDRTYSILLNSSSPQNDSRMFIGKFEVEQEKAYQITVQSTNALNVKIYNENFNCCYNSDNYYTNSSLIQRNTTFSAGVYYMTVEFENQNVISTVTINIKDPTHEHSLNPLWIYYDIRSHRKTCSTCQETVLEGHYVKYDDVMDGDNMADCQGCLANLDLSRDYASILSLVRKVTLNGSFVLPSGIVVLKDEDVEAYQSGTLVFYDEDELLLTA